MAKPPLAQQAEAATLKVVQSEFESQKGDHPIYKPPYWRIYGPYYRKDGRQHIVAYDGMIKRTISYPRFLLETHLGRVL